MIYDFVIPNIIDTKDIYDTFTKKSHVSKENYPKIKKISRQRKGVKETLKYFNSVKSEEALSYSLIDEVILYAESAAELGPIFEKDYVIHKNWKWSPILSDAKILKFSKSIKAGKSAEIIMARYSAFAACFRSVRKDVSSIKQNLFFKQTTNLGENVTFMELMKPDAVTEHLQNAIYNVLKAQVKAWMLLKKYYERSENAFKIWSQFSDRPLEMRPTGMQIALLVTKMNSNVLYIEYLRLHNNYEEMGKYAKMIVTQAFLVEQLLSTENYTIDGRLREFIKISQVLYKAIALWSLFFPYMARIRTDMYQPGEDINVLAGGCYSFVVYIGEMHRFLLNLPYLRNSFLYPMVCFYFKDVLVTKSQEAWKAYSQVFNNFVYNEFHFNRMEELDYMARTTGDES